nr:hypothetical protein [uncultured Janthinobacterium sp.]
MQPIVAIASSLNYTVFYFPQSYFTPPTAILAAFLDLLVATAQIVMESIENFPSNHGCFAKSRSSHARAPAPEKRI